MINDDVDADNDNDDNGDYGSDDNDDRFAVQCLKCGLKVNVIPYS